MTIFYTPLADMRDSTPPVSLNERAYDHLATMAPVDLLDYLQDYTAAYYTGVRDKTPLAMLAQVLIDIQRTGPAAFLSRTGAATEDEVGEWVVATFGINFFKATDAEAEDWRDRYTADSFPPDHLDPHPHPTITRET